MRGLHNVHLLSASSIWCVQRAAAGAGLHPHRAVRDCLRVQGQGEAAWQAQRLLLFSTVPSRLRASPKLCHETLSVCIGSLQHMQAAEMAKSFKPAELPAQFRASPHEYLKKLNHVRGAGLGLHMAVGL